MLKNWSLVGLAILLSSCGGGNDDSESTPTPMMVTPAPTPAPTITLTPTLTPEPSPTPVSPVPIDPGDLPPIQRVEPSDVRVDFVAWGEGGQQFGYLYHFDSELLLPVVVMIHGGCWSSSWTYTLQSSLSQALAERGFAVWNIEYRRMGNGGDWPIMFQDVAAAADYVKNLASSYNLDADRIVSMGHSAGGHLALWLMAREKLTSRSPLYTSSPTSIRGAVSLAGIPDLTSGACGSSALNIIDRQALSDSEFALRLEEASPLQMLPTGKRSVLLSGGLDGISRPEISERYALEAQLASDESYHVNTDDAGHFYFITATDAYVDELARYLQLILRSEE